MKCKICNQEIEFINGNWDHKGPVKPRHMAVPGVRFMGDHKPDVLSQVTYDDVNMQLKENWNGEKTFAKIDLPESFLETFFLPYNAVGWDVKESAPQVYIFTMKQPGPAVGP